MEIVSNGLTDVGLKREHNEDAFVCDAENRLFIVADGMGGRAAGETASQAVIAVLPVMLREQLTASEDPTPGQITFLIGKTLSEFSEQLFQQSQELPEIKGLGSTVALLFVRDEMAYVGCAGDSRVYLLRDAHLFQITKDQTIAAALVRTGHLSADKAAFHPLSHALEEYVGGYDDWLAQKQAATPPVKEAAPALDKKKLYKEELKTKQKRKLSFSEQREIQALPAQIEALEQEQSTLHANMADPAFYRQPKEAVAAAVNRLTELAAEITHAYARWEYLEALDSPR